MIKTDEQKLKIYILDFVPMIHFYLFTSIEILLFE